MFCRMCGKQIPEDSRFCQFCGTEVISPNEKAIDAIIKLTEQEARVGVEKTVVIDGTEAPLKINLPGKINNGQLICLHKVKFINNEGKKEKKDVYIKVEVLKEDKQ